MVESVGVLEDFRRDGRGGERWGVPGLAGGHCCCGGGGGGWDGGMWWELGSGRLRGCGEPRVLVCGREGASDLRWA